MCSMTFEFYIETYALFKYSNSVQLEVVCEL